MIHWTPEGYIPELGLNFYICKRWLRIVWVWYRCRDYSKMGWYIRFRWAPTPKIFIDYYPWKSVIDGYLFEGDFILMSRRDLV